MTVKIGALLLAVPLSIAPLSDMGASDHAGNLSYLESDVCCGVFTKSDSGIRVERQKITISVDELPPPAYPNLRPARVVTEYAFRNTAQTDAEITLYFPVPATEEKEKSCAVEVAGESVAPVRRYAFHGTSKFDAPSEVAKITNEWREDSFFHADADVTTTTFVFRPDAACEEPDYFHLVYNYNPNTTRLIFDKDAIIKTTDGKVHAYWLLSHLEGSEKKSKKVEVYAVGENILPDECYVSSDAAGTKRDALCAFAPASADPVKTRFGDFVGNLRPPDVGSTDWYNGVVDMLNVKTKDGYSTVTRNAITADWLRPWYEYAVTVPAGGTVVNTVACTLMPRVTLNAGKYVYSYQYLLSSAGCWSDFEQLQIDIVTPYSLYEPSLTFEKTQGGYELIRSDLPRGELTFSLTEKPEKSWGNRPAGLSPSTIVAIVLLCVLAAGGATAAIVYSVIKRKRKKSK